MFNNYYYDGWIYFIAEDNNQRIKIGYSKDPEKRLKQLKTGNSNGLRIVKTIPGNKIEENKYHKYFERYKIPNSKEWFIFSEEILAFVAR